MAKKELYRKITATVLTAAALGCALGICIWLLVSSSVFSNALRLTMLICTVALAVAIVGLVLCKIQEIRTLAEIVRLDQAKQAAAPGGELPLSAAGQEHPVPPQAEPAPPEPPVQPAPTAQESPSPAMPEPPEPDWEGDGAVTVNMPESPQETPAHRPWKPINFKAFEQKAQEDEAARKRAVEQAAEKARHLLEEQARLDAQSAAEHRAAMQAATELYQQHSTAAAQQPQPDADPVPDAAFQPQRAHEEARQAAPADEVRRLHDHQRQQAQAQEDARRAALLDEIRRVEEARRAEQLRMAEDARTGRVTTDAAEEQRLAALARKADEERQTALRGASAAPVNREQWVNAAQTPAAPELGGIAIDTPASPASPAVSAPSEPAQEEPVRKLNVKPISWPSPPPPSKLFVTSQVPVVTDEMIAAEKARQAAEKAAEAWQKSN